MVEFNARFGDPETQGCLQLLESDLYDAMSACADGPSLATTPEFKLEFKKDAAVAIVVMASPGYPGSYPKGLPITGLGEAAAMAGVKVFHAGTKLLEDGATVATSGGRVLAVTAIAADLKEALASDIDDAFTSFLVNSRALIGSRGFRNGIRGSHLWPSWFGSKLPRLC